MPTQKRQRKRTGREARQAYLAAQRRSSRRRRSVVAAVLVGILVLGVATIVGGGGGGDRSDVASATSTTVAQPVSVPPGATISGDTPCPAPDGSSARTSGFAKPPPMCIDPTKAYSAEVKTDKGTFTVALDAKAAPQTANNFVVLSRYHYFDGVGFHRIIPGFVVQGGDPQGTGTGGPGYQFADELPPPGQYKEGSLAMANSGPNTNGSQFFVVTGPQGSALPNKYSLFGQVTGGMDVVKAIEAAGTPEGKPKETVKIESVTIKES